MKLRITLLIIFTAIYLLSCGGGTTLSPEKALEFSGRSVLPTQEEFPDAGGVILYEDSKVNLLLDGNYNVYTEESYHRSLLYFNEKAEDYITEEIYLDDDISLINFSARTIKPNGEIIELTRDDLHPTQIKEDFIMFTDDKSVKFTFPGVEKGAILEYSYKIVNEDDFYTGDFWAVQSYLPKLYTRYSVELPSIFFKYDIDWNFSSSNFTVGPPKTYKNLMNQKSNKDRSRIFYWEVKDIPALKREPQMPPYRDVAQYVRFALKYDNWNELTRQYWKHIGEYFNYSDDEEVKELAESVIGDAEDDVTKVKRIFEYVQKNYRYVAVQIGNSGMIPHEPSEIIKNQYGDCKDMTVMLVNLLKAAGIEAHPALVNTRDRCKSVDDIIKLDFNHMITYVNLGKKDQYWLDATGSSCPLGEVYSSIEGTQALVLDDDGNSYFKSVPKSKSKRNRLERKISLHLNNDGSVNGTANITFKGNDNLAIRSGLFDASENDIHKVMESYVNSNTPDLKIDSLIYDDPNEIGAEFNIRIEFSKDKIGSFAGDLLIFKSYIFELEPELDRFRDEERTHPLFFNSSTYLFDEIEIEYDPEAFEVSSLGKNISEDFNQIYFKSFYNNSFKGKINISRIYSVDGVLFTYDSYKYWRNIHKAIAAANEENVVLNKL